jgi:hypothetical protein
MLKLNHRLLLWVMGPLVLLLLGFVLYRADSSPSPRLEVRVLDQVRTDGVIQISVLVTNSGTLPLYARMPNSPWNLPVIVRATPTQIAPFPVMEFRDGEQWIGEGAVSFTGSARDFSPLVPHGASRVEFLVPATATQIRFKSYCGVLSIRNRLYIWLYKHPRFRRISLYPVVYALPPFHTTPVDFASPEYKVEAR